MWKFYCDCCGKQVIVGQPIFGILIDSKIFKLEYVVNEKKIMVRTVCEDCADKVLELLGGEAEGGEAEGCL